MTNFCAPENISNSFIGYEGKLLLKFHRKQHYKQDWSLTDSTNYIFQKGMYVWLKFFAIFWVLQIIIIAAVFFSGLEQNV